MIRVEHGDMLDVIPGLVAEGIVADAVVTAPARCGHPTVTARRSMTGNDDYDAVKDSYESWREAVAEMRRRYLDEHSQQEQASEPCPFT